MSDGRLERLVSLAAQHEEKLLGAVGEIRVMISERKAKLAQLQQFGREYEVRQAALGGDGASVTVLRDYGRFITRLHESMAEQTELLNALSEEEAMRRNAWMEAMRERKRLATLAERRLTEHRRVQAMADQAAEDEAARHARRLRSNLAR